MYIYLDTKGHRQIRPSLMRNDHDGIWQLIFKSRLQPMMTPAVQETMIKSRTYLERDHKIQESKIQN